MIPCVGDSKCDVWATNEKTKWRNEKGMKKLRYSGVSDGFDRQWSLRQYLGDKKLSWRIIIPFKPRPWESLISGLIFTKSSCSVVCNSLGSLDIHTKLHWIIGLDSALKYFEFSLFHRKQKWLIKYKNYQRSEVTDGLWQFEMLQVVAL